MCGLAGFLNAKGSDSEDSLRSQVTTMANQLAHRGPDDSGEWVDGSCQLALGHRRLSIIDTSSDGHQPMISGSGRFVIAYNGEVYNFLALRGDLEKRGVRFKSSSDTEVVLAAIEAYGLREAVTRFVGMFAFALWDRESRSLHLVRDRLGIKPLYYGHVGSRFVFGSELKALTCTPGFRGTVNRAALAKFVQYSYVPAPHSIFEGIAKQMPGTIVSLSADSPESVQTETYWDANEVARSGLGDLFRGSDAEAIDMLDEILTDAVVSRMVSDVPLGAFLSGGYDSSLVAGIMQRESRNAIKTFSIGFTDREFDESQHAEAVANHLGTEHTSLLVTPREAQSVIPLLPDLYDEPFSDSSQIPTFLVSRLAREKVTVSLSGDGGDELFAGYNRHTWVGKLWRWMRYTPAGLRKVAARGVMSVPSSTWNNVARRIGYVIPPLRHQRRVGENMHKLSGVLAARGPQEIYAQLISHWHDGDGLVLGANSNRQAVEKGDLGLDGSEYAQKMLLMDQTNYLPNDILTKVDRASMGVSLEARVPLIDHRVFEFAWRLPLTMKVRERQSKWILRQLVYRMIPADLMERPKAGFGIPIGEWLRGPLKQWAGDLLDESRIRRDGYFDAALVVTKWNEHLRGIGSWHYDLWDILMFQAWLDKAQK